jgi:hypothetical protein
MRTKNRHWLTARREAAEEFGVIKESIQHAFDSLEENHPLQTGRNKVSETQKPLAFQLYEDLKTLLEAHPHTFPTISDALKALQERNPNYAHIGEKSLPVIFSGGLLDGQKETIKSLLDPRHKKLRVVDELTLIGKVGMATKAIDAARIYTRLHANEPASALSCSVYWSTYAQEHHLQQSRFILHTPPTPPLPEDDAEFLQEMVTRIQARLAENAQLEASDEIPPQKITLNDIATALTWPKDKLDELETLFEGMVEKDDHTPNAHAI